MSLSKTHDGSVLRRDLSRFERKSLIERFYDPHHNRLTELVAESLKRMVVEGRNVHDLRAEAERQGMVTLRRVGLLNAARGRTSLEEVLRVTLEE